MVVSKDGKRKRKESPIVETSPEIPKRTKIQAQRKFAQGQGNPSASYSISSAIAAGTSQPNTPARDTNKDSIPELIPHKKPSAEDLVTYICFRGTPGLPPHLDFFNQNKKNAEKDEKDNKETKPAAKATTPTKKAIEKIIKAEKPEKCDEKIEKNDKAATATNDKSNKKATEKSENPESMGFAVRKRADQVVEGNRKFRNNERLTRLRGRTPKAATGNRRSPRNRSARVENEDGPDDNDDDDDGNDEDEECDGEENENGQPETDKVSEKSEPKKPTPKKQQPPAKGKRKIGTPVKDSSTERESQATPVSNLRSKRGQPSTPAPKPQEQIKQPPEPKVEPVKLPEKRSESVSKKSDVSSKVSSTKTGKKTPIKRNLKAPAKVPSEDEAETTVTETSPPKPKRGRKSAANTSAAKRKSNETESPKPADTPQQSENNTLECDSRTGRPMRPMRKTKEAATIYMELIGLKLNLDDFDDDGSMASFPDLPNAKETQKMENELKQNALKQPKTTSNSKPVKKAAAANKAKTAKKVEPETKTEPLPKTKPPKMESTKKDVNKNEKPKVLEKSFSDSDDEPLVTQKTEVEVKEIVKTKSKAKTVKKRAKPPPKTSAAKRKVVELEKSEVVEEKPDLPPPAEIVIEKLEKSFSDSDDEPLATKVNLKSGAVEKETKEEPLQIITQITPVIIPKSSPPKEEKAAVSPKKPSVNANVRPIEERPLIKSPMSPKHPPKPHVITAAVPTPPITTPISPPSAPATPAPFVPFPSPKVNPSFLTPKFDRNLERRPMESFSSATLKTSIPSPTTLPKLDLSSKPASPSSSSNNAKKFEAQSISAANLMPSKEESSKIFGIASVTLAQSSGPDNTKCTLGKCGSIHKPSLGPVVPTEAYLGEPLSSKERRKAKVNMTHEQIQKWLIECSSNPDEIQDDLDDDYDEPLKPKTFAPTPPPVRDEKDSGSSSKTAKEMRSEGTWSGKGPSLKATPVIAKEDSRPSPLLTTELIAKRESPFERSMSPKQQKFPDTSAKAKTPQSPLTIKKSDSISKLSRDNNTKSPKPSTSSATSSPKHLKATTKVTPVTQKKLPAAPKRQPVYSTKPTGAVAAAATTTPDSGGKKKPSNSFAAFSPENETSVYSFDKEDDVPPPVAKPFRRHSRRESNADENTSSEKPSRVEKQTKEQQQQQNSISVTLNPEDASKSVKVSLDGGDSLAAAPATAAKKVDKPTDATGPPVVGDSDSEGHTFYIPLQGTGAAAASSGKPDMIQGVAVKLGREGPDGPNQRVIMHATLVTKAQMGSNTTPIPESMNVHEIVKSLLSTTTATMPIPTGATANKDATTPTASKSVPIGTVQPRFKSNPDLLITAAVAAPIAAIPQNASSSGLQRANSNSSLLSGSTKSKPPPPTPAATTPTTVQPKKPKDVPAIKMFNNTAFPRRDDPTQMVEAPIFRPTEKEFQDPIEFIERITPIAARFGICKIIPPDCFKPECRVSDDMRFTAYNQYVHKMLHRWGPSAKEFSAIKKYLATQSIAMTHPPWIGGMEIDLPRLYHTVQELGGLKEVIEKKKWTRVAEEMCIPKLAQDRVTKLDDIYCKYLLPYDTLSPAERQKLFDEVEADWAKREARARRNADRCVNLESISNEDGESSDNDDESDEEVDGVSMECIVKGRNMPLNAFFRIARNTLALWFKNTEPTVADIEAEFWRHVAVRDSHVCVHSGSIDSSGWGYGFPTPGPKTKGSPCAKHPWNLKVLTNNAGSVLRSLGSVIGVTVPTLHVGMLFSACCWYRDPHGLSWIEYLHTGASKIWYGIPDEQSSNFRTALTALIPTHCQNKTIWLPCDTVMVPPHMLTDRGVSLCRVEQKPGEYVVVFPRAYTSSVATGYVVSESVYFATSSWLDSARDDFRDIHDSCEPAMFSLEQLLFALAGDQRIPIDILSQMLPMLVEVYDKEVAARQQLKASGLQQTEKFQVTITKTKQKLQVAEEHECDLCRANLYISLVKTTDGNIYCLQHALRNINNSNIQAKQCTLVFTYDIEDIENLIKKVKERLSAVQQQKKGPGNVSTSKKAK